MRAPRPDRWLTPPATARWRSLASPSGTTAHMTTPSTMPAPAPMASVAGATRGRPRRHDEDGSHVAGHDEQENGLGEPDESDRLDTAGAGLAGHHRRSVHDLLEAGLGYRQDQHRRIGTGPQHPRTGPAAGGRKAAAPAAAARPAPSSTVTTSTRATAVAMLPAGPGQAAPGHPRRRRRETPATGQPGAPAALPRAISRIRQPARPAGPPGRHLARLGPQRLGPVSPLGRHQPRRSPAQPAHGTAGAATPRPPPRPGTRPGRPAGPQRPAPPSQWPARRQSAGTKCRRGRPGVGSSCQHASTRPRSASRIRIGYSVPDFSPVCPASAYPCCHCDGLGAQRRQHQQRLRRELRT